MKENSISIHERNIQSSAIEIYKFLNGLSPVFRKNILNNYDLQNHKGLSSRNSKTETFSYIALKIWSKVPETIKMRSSLESLKSKI